MLRNLFKKAFGTESFRLVRKEAPQTSHEAAKTVDTANLEYRVYEAIQSFGQDGCISDEVLQLFPHSPYSSVTARYRALYEKGYIEIIGTRKGHSGKPQRVMRAKP